MSSVLIQDNDPLYKESNKDEIATENEIWNNLSKEWKSYTNKKL